MTTSTVLADWPIGRPARLVTTPDGAAGQRLAQLGLRTGDLLVPLVRTPGRGVVLAVGEVRVALDREGARAIHVQDPA